MLWHIHNRRSNNVNRTTVVLSEDLKLRAREQARREGIPFSELVRQAIAARVDDPAGRVDEDPLFGDVPVYEGPVPANLSEDHDTDLYGDLK
jgi:hypothetical protein